MDSSTNHHLSTDLDNIVNHTEYSGTKEVTFGNALILSSRIPTQGMRYIVAKLEMASTLFPLVFFRNFFPMLQSFLSRLGTSASVTPTCLLPRRLFQIIQLNFLLLLRLYVMVVLLARFTNFLFLFLNFVPLNHYNLFAVIYGVQLQSLLMVIKAIMSCFTI
ncbi:hypothetical protein LINPERPRIM_LOCUS38724, partial [Linum perenne]